MKIVPSSAKSRVLLTFAVLILLVSTLALAKNYMVDNSLTAEISQEGNTQNAVHITKSKTTGETKLNFEQINFDITSIVKDPIIQDLPASAVIELTIGETSYTLAQNAITRGSPTNPDISITVPARYLSQLAAMGLCETIKQANADKTLVVQTHASETALLWKYKSMFKYRDCLG